MSYTPTEAEALRRRRARERARQRREEEARRLRRAHWLAASLGIAGTLTVVGAYGAWRTAHERGGLRATVKAVAKQVAVTTGVAVPGSGGAAALAAQAVERADAPLVVFRDGLSDGWDDWSWATHDKSAAQFAAVGSVGVSMLLKNNEGVYFHHSPFPAGGYGALEFLYKGGPSAVMATLFDENNKTRRQLVLSSYRTTESAPPGWVKVRIPLSAFGIGRTDQISGVVLQSAVQGSAGTVGFDEILLTPDTSLPAAPTELTVSLSVDATAQRKAISPYIYGVAHASREEVMNLGATLNRWGGNPNSRHNWVNNAWSSASDWEFRNQGPGHLIKAGQGADEFVRDSAAGGAEAYLTVPTLGWVALDRDNNHKSEGVPAMGAAGLQGCDGPISGYDPTGNRLRTSVRSRARKGGAFQLNPNPVGATSLVYQDEWINHLVKTFGPSQKGGVPFYCMDNEPDLWSFTHRDVHPAHMGYDDVLQNFNEYAAAVKAIDPNAQIAGPAVSGWTGFFYSALDRGTDNFRTHADKRGHGDEPFVLWFLKQLQAQDRKSGKRTLDILDIHYYPQGQNIYSAAADPATRALRLRSVRSLWDPSYADESWIGGTPEGPAVRLIPRMKEWIAQGYPGTKLAIGEWNFGGEDDISGGLATAEALGVFGREGVDIACLWTKPKLGSPAAAAFQLYRRPEPGQPGFGDRSCQAISTDPNRLAAFAAVDSKTGALTLMLINKLPKATVSVPIALRGLTAPGGVRLWRFSADNPGRVVALPGPSAAGDKLTLALPPYSATLVRLGGTSK